MSDSPPPDSPPPAPPEVASVPQVPWRWTDALLVVVLVFLSGIVVLPLVSGLGQFANPVLVLVSALLTGGITIQLTRRRYGVRAAWLLTGQRRPVLRDVWVGIGAAFIGQLGITLIVLLLTAGGRAPEVQEELRRAASNPTTLPLMALGVVLLVPIAEEFLYRGMLFQALRARLGRWPAIGISGFFFGLLHAQVGDLAGTLLLLAAFYPFGMYLAWLFDRRGSLLVPIVCHVVYNGSNLALFLSGR